MKIVRKNKPGQPLQPAGDAVAEDERLLNHWYDSLSYADRRHDRSTPFDGQVGRILKKLRDRNLWLACECLSNDPAQPNGQSYLSSHLPILCPIQLDTWGRRYSFRRIRRSIPHHPSCIFFSQARLDDQFAFEQSPEKPLETSISSLQPLSHSTSFALDLKDPEETDLAISLRPQSMLSVLPRSRSTLRPKLARMLFTLLEEAQLHVIRPGWWNQRNISFRQQRSLQRTKRHIVNRIPLKHYLTTQPATISGGYRKLAALANNGNSDWPPHVKPQAFFAGIVSEVDRENQTLQALGHPEALQVENEPICFVPPSGSASGPFWGFAHIGESLVTPGRYVLRRAYVHPVFSSELLVPVDSHAERQTLDILLAAQRQLHSLGCQIAIAKPLHDFCTHAGEPYRPDFVLYPHRRGQGMQPGACIVVETMGFADRDYAERKARTHRRMRELGDVMAWDVRGDISDERKRMHQIAVVKACNGLIRQVKRN